MRPEDIISTWLDNKISLYVNLRSEYCRITRYANKKEHRYDTFDTSVGRGFYQHETSPQSKVRKFIPCGQSEIKEGCNFSGSSFYRYIYNGYARGFWRLLPTSTTHLATDNFNLKNANCYVADIASQILRDLFSYNEASKVERYDPPYNRSTMELLINEIVSVNGHVTCSNVCTILSANRIVAVWQMLLTRLLRQHYGLTLNDTPFNDEMVIKEHFDAGITLADAVNFLVEKY